MTDHADKFITGNALKNLFISSEQVTGTRLTLITDREVNRLADFCSEKQVRSTERNEKKSHFNSAVLAVRYAGANH